MIATQLLARYWRHIFAAAQSDNFPSENLRAVAHTWEALARSDPLWAVLSEPGKRGRRWECDAFFRNGEQQVKGIFSHAEASGAHIRRGVALDFGCGVGRLSRALASHFTKVVGVDISETMIRIARELHADRPNLDFLLNRRSDLRILRDGEFDFVCSHITLQHLRPELAESYIREFFRVTRPDGYVFFQIPSHLISAGYENPLPPTEKPLPPEECRADISVRSAPAVLCSGSQGRVIAGVRNTSQRPWRCQLNLGNHWRNLDGGMVQNDDGRTSLPSLGSGETVEIALDVFAPIEAGAYRLELDLVQEGVRWFAQAGSATTSVPISVEATTYADDSKAKMSRAITNHIDPVYKPAPAFEMHGIHRKRIEHLAQEAGMKLIHCDDYRTVWLSHEYLFVKPP